MSASAPTWRSLLLKGVVGLAITGALVAFLLRYVQWEHVRQLARRTDWRLIAVGFICYVGMYLVRAVRFRALVPQAPYAVMLSITCVHNFLLRLLPLRSGELSFSFLTRRAGLAGFGESLLGLVLLRLLDATVVVLLFALTLALNRSLFHGDPQVGLAVAVGLGACGVGAVLLFGRLLALGTAVARGVSGLLGLRRIGRVERLLDKLTRTIDAYARLRLGLLARLWLLTLLLWLLNFALVFAMMRAFSIPLSVPQAVLGGTAGTVSGFLPVGGIGSFGTLEAGWALGFALVGLESHVAVASGFGFSFGTFAFAIPLALAGWLGLSSFDGRRQTVGGD